MGEITEALHRAKRDGSPGIPPEAESIPSSRPFEIPKSVLGPAAKEPREKARRVLPEPKRPLLPLAGSFANRDLMSFREIVRTLQRRRVAASGIFGVVMACVVLVTFIQTPIYESSAILLVKLGREFRDSVDPGELTTPASHVINTEMVILRSQEVIEGVVAAMGPGVLYPKLGEAANGNGAQGVENGEIHSPEAPATVAARRFAANLRVEAVPDTQVIQIAFQHPEPQIAADAVNTLVDLFMERHLWAFGQSEATAFLEGKVAAFREKLGEKEDALSAFLEQHPRFTVANVGDVVGRERRELSSELDAVRREIAASQRERKHLEDQRTETTSRYENAELRSELDEQILTVSARLSGLGAREAAIRTQVAKYDSEISELPGLRKYYDELVRDRDSTNNLYETYSRQLEQALVSEEMNRQKIANISVLQAGIVPTSPVRPQKALYLMVGAVVAAGLALLAALVAEATAPRAR